MPVLLSACLVAAIVSSPSGSPWGGVRSSILSVPDLNGDDVPEVAVVRHEALDLSPLTLCNGADGGVLWSRELKGRFLAMTPTSRYGKESRVVVATHPADLRAFDASTGELSWEATIEFGDHEQVTNLETVPDLDGDELQDLLVFVGGRYPAEKGRLRLLSGASGAELSAWDSFEMEGRRARPTGAFGVRFDADGKQSKEIAIGVCFEGAGDDSTTHAIALFDLEQGKAKELRVMPGPMWLITDAGDFDGDGVNDLAVTHEVWWLDILSGAEGRQLQRRGFPGGQLWDRASTLAVLRQSCAGRRPQVVYSGSFIGSLKNEHGRTIEDGDCERTLWWAYLEEVIDLKMSEEDQDCVDLATSRHPRDPRLDAVLVHLPLQRRVLLVEGETGRSRWNRVLEWD